MEPAHLIAFNLTLLAAMASPGPAMLMALRATLLGGWRAGILTGVGLGIAAAGWTAMALLGLDAVFRLFPWAYVALKALGAAYLLYLAVTIWRDARRPLAPAAAPHASRHAVLGGVLVNLSDPKSVLFASAILLVIFPPDLSLTQKALIVGNHMVVEWLVYTGFALALSTRTARDGYLRLKPVLDRIAAAVLGALGLRLLLER
jgi:threonine/homoserine/homoserine lactone efflux protein